MARQDFLNTKKVKEIHGFLNKQWGVEEKLDYYFLSNETGKIWIVNRDIADIDLDKMRVNAVGAYFGELVRDELRLSIEGSQLIGPKATKNIIDLDENQAKKWLMGQDLEYDNDYLGFVIVRLNSDYLGTGKLKERRLLNYVPKVRRLNASH